MNRIKWLLWFFMAGSVLAEDEHADDYRRILEQKYGGPVVSLEVVPVSPTTKVLWFEWQERWWGSLNVIETNPDGTPLFWYDITEFPTGQSLERVKIVDLSGIKYIEVIDCTHMGNGMLYLYQIRNGRAELKLGARVIANLDQEFEPRVANIQYLDLNADGQKDVVLDARVVSGKESDEVDRPETTYHREFLFERDLGSTKFGRFVERVEQRRGPKNFME